MWGPFFLKDNMLLQGKLCTMVADASTKDPKKLPADHKTVFSSSIKNKS
jgi:hypothetical protein